MRTLFLILSILLYHTYNSQNLNVDYIVTKINKNDTIQVPYTLKIETSYSIFFPTYKCKSLQNNENDIPKFSSELIYVKDKLFRTYDKIGNANVYFKPERKQLSWKITNVNIEENGFKLKKATLNYNNRKWEALFIEELPIPEGPYFFKGLPGLIYSLKDVEGNLSFQLKEISKDKSMCKIDLKNYKEISYQKYISTIKNASDIDNSN